jgi:flagellar protein FlgJ
MHLAFDPQVALNTYEEQTDIGTNSRNNPGTLKKMCQDFESIFIYTMFQEMHDSVPDAGYVEQGSESEIFQDMMHMEVAKNMAQHQGLGLAEMLYTELSGREDKG